MMRRLFSLVSVAAIAAVCGPGWLAGQTGQVWAEPRGGWLAPTSDLGRTDVLGNTGFGVFGRVDQSPMLGVGAGVELGAGWTLRSSLDRSLGATVRGEWQCVPFVGCPAVLLPLEGELSHWTAAIDALYRPATALPLDPVVFAGLGLRRSQLDWGQPPADVTLPAFSFSETVAVYRFGTGVQRSLGRAKVFGEVQATAVRFGGGPYESIEGSIEADRKLSLDMGFIGGVRLRLH